jgi:hypothetical protein
MKDQERGVRAGGVRGGVIANCKFAISNGKLAGSLRGACDDASQFEICNLKFAIGNRPAADTVTPHPSSLIPAPRP